MDVGNRAAVFADRLRLDTVRELHQTVRLLRSALDESKVELERIRTHVHDQKEISHYESTINQLAIENHILRQKVIDDSKVAAVGQVRVTSETSVPIAIKVEPMDPDSKTKETAEVKVDEGKENVRQEEEEKSVEDATVIENVSAAGRLDVEEKTEKTEDLADVTPGSAVESKVVNGDHVSAGSDHKEIARGLSEDADQSCGSENSPPNFPGDKEEVGESDNESEELDDIELIFTTDDTKELGVLQEDLVSFTDNDGWQTTGPQIMVKFQDADSFDETAEIENEAECNREKNGSSSEKMQSNLKTWSHSVFVETDISKCGVVDENEAPGRSPRRNTLPNPLVYQPIIHREVLNGNKGQSGTSPVSPRPFGTKFFPSNRSPRSSNTFGKSPIRPILVERNSSKRESEAQTDITALPSHWRSESYLAHKVNHNFTTLPSKFNLPIQQNESGKYSLKLCDKTQEARRTLLSDINFTSMVPELSRSADHLCRGEGRENCVNNVTPGTCKNYPRAQTYMKSTAENLVSPGYFYSRDYGKDMWSPCDCAQSNLLPYGRVRSSWDNYQPITPRYRGSLTSMPSYEFGDPKRRHSSSAWRDSPEMYRSTSMSQRPTFGSVPSSPTHNTRSRSIPFSPSYASSRNDVFPATQSYWSGSRDSSQFGTALSKNARQPTSRSRARNKVTFHESSFRRPGRPGQSLPDLRADFGPESGESTDSLIDESEEYLRRSIDSILTGSDYARVGARRHQRRFSDPDPIREFVVPKTAQPFLPKVPRDLKMDHLVKVINSEGRVLIGRVRYVGTVQTGGEPFVGVELPTDSGNTDGLCNGRRYFDCDPDHAVFVPFKKVVIAWSF